MKLNNYAHMDAKPNIPKIQADTLRMWKVNSTFARSVKEKKNGEVVFYDGPPFPTGIPHHGTVLVSFIKDLVARYKTMRGYSVPRVWGWDCHGLPIEEKAEKALGITDKTVIEKSFGIDKFNDACYNIVSQNNDAWAQYVEEMARWVDYDGAYKTMHLSYMESVMWAFKTCYDKGLIYQDYRVTPYCTRCQTSLSISDTRESDSTRPRQDSWAIVRFKANKEVDGMPVYFLAWTTTPWTLPSNMALAVGPNIDYAYVKVDDIVYAAGKDALARYKGIFGEEPVILGEFKGKELEGTTYEPLFDCFKDKANEGAYRVICADYVDTAEGIEIVHIAPAFGEDDYWACKKAGVPLVNPVDEKGLFTSDVKRYEGRHVMECNQDIIRQLREEGKLVSTGSIEHNYPHCWRCRQPLIYKAMKAWYFNIEAIKDRLIELNEDINWIPETVKHGRFGKWLENARDWNISRNRYWSTPIPVWECDECKKRVVLGSLDEIEEKSGVRLDNLHRQYVDKIHFKCECGGEMHRIPEVLDCWFESASVPFAQKHYPFENKEWFESHYPCDFVVEYTGQIRCWFYYLHVLAVALFDKPAYKNCIVHGTILARDGKKLSKSSKNYTDPMELMKKYGTDAFRLYLYRTPAMLIGDLLFNDAGLEDSLKQIIIPLWNACNFYTSYANIDGFCPDSVKEPDPENSLDKWILAMLYNTESTIRKSMDEYGVDNYVEPIIDFISGLTNWYIRRSRRRFWESGLSKDKKDAYETLYYVLVNLCKIMAPAAPIISEHLYGLLTGEESVHLADWTEIPERYRDDQLIEEVDVVQQVITLARSLRSKNNVQNRQPLNLLMVAVSDAHQQEVVENSIDIICEELNVKRIEMIAKADDIATVIYKLNFNSIKANYGADKIGPYGKALREHKYSFTKQGMVLHLDSGDVQLKEEDILVEYKAKEGMHVAGFGNIVVSLDLNITEELLREGIARVIVRNIQDARKQLECELTERILIGFDGEYPTEWADYICKETLSEITDIDAPDSETEIQTKYGALKVRIKRK